MSCTLSLLRSTVRKSPLLKDDEYKRIGSEDDRFADYFGTIQSVVTSSANNDSGMFETNLRDERFLPFEGAGAESTWKLELPSEFRQFDYDTISDVILHVRYTARQGGAQLGEKAVEHIRDLVALANESGLALLFSLKHDFPSEWHQFSTSGSDPDFTATIKRDYFPYFTQGKDVTIDAIELHAIKADNLQAYVLDTARKAEQTMKHELMRPEVDATDYVTFNYWDAGRKGLLSGEALWIDVKRMETAYLDNDKREYELTKHVSLRQLDPLALLALKAAGSCEVAVPEWLFDLNNPGHYMRRIKNVSLSIPSVTGPYTSVSCTLSLLRSTVRKSPLLKDDEYKRIGSEDDRFADYFGTIQSVVTSSANNDSGMFETNLRDERFLPFEGAGAESTWKLELPSEFRQFDYDTISDVILHVRYTARQGGAQLGEKAVEHIRDLVALANESGLALLFSLKHDFPSEWHQFSTSGSDPDFTATIKRDYFPYFTQGKDVTIDAIELHAIKADNLQSVTPPGLDQATLDTMTENLKDEEEFELSIAPDAQVLVRDKEARVFMLIKYSMESA